VSSRTVPIKDTEPVNRTKSTDKIRILTRFLKSRGIITALHGNRIRNLEAASMDMFSVMDLETLCNILGTQIPELSSSLWPVIRIHALIAIVE